MLLLADVNYFAELYIKVNYDFSSRIIKKIIFIITQTITPRHTLL